MNSIEQKRLPSLAEISGIKLALTQKDNEIQPDRVSNAWTRRLSHLNHFYNELSINERWQQIVRDFGDQQDKFCKGVFAKDDPRGIIYTQIAAYLSDDEMRRSFLRNIDLVTVKESETLLKSARENGNIIDNLDIIFVGGTGLHGSIATTELQTYSPTPSYLSIDALHRRGGRTFRIFPEAAATEIGVFVINSLPTTSFSSQKKHINAPAHLETISERKDVRPYQDLFAAVIAVNSYLSSRSIQGATVKHVEDHGEEGSTTTIFERNGEIFTVYASKVVIARGLGKPHIPVQRSPTTEALLWQANIDKDRFINNETNQLPHIVIADAFWEMLVARKGEVLNQLVGKKVVLVGAEDSAQSVLKLLFGYASPEAYEKYRPELGRPKIFWMVAAPYPDRIWLRPQHEVLRSHIGDGIHLFAGRAVDLQNGVNGIEVVYSSSNTDKLSQEEADMIIYCTGYTEDSGMKVKPELRYVMDSETGDVLGKGNQNVYMIGPTANIPLTQEEVEANPAFATRHGTSNAANRLVPKTQRLIQHIVSQLHESRS